MRLREWQRELIRNTFDTTDEHGDRRVRRALWSVGRKNGKGLALDTPIPTPAGWATMGEIQQGDMLFDENGDVCRVTMVSEVRRLDCYEFEFSNGERIVCDGDHLWKTTARISRPGRGYDNSRCSATQVRDAREIFATQRVGKRGDVNHSLSMPGALQLPHAELPVNPYILGLWLGDGHSRSARLTVAPEDYEQLSGLFALYGLRPVVRTEKGKTALTVTLKQMDFRDGGPVAPADERNLNHKLRILGVLGDKHIPPAYLRASYVQRAELLRGLMDTDGTVDKGGKVLQYVTVSKKLADGVAELLASLGLKFSVRETKMRCNGRPVPGTAYSLQFCAFADELPCFSLPRKLARMRTRAELKTAPRSRTVQIVNVRRVDTVPTKCIQVDSPSRLFRVGRTMLPTHNSALAAALLLCALVGPLSQMNGEVYSAATTRDQAAMVYKMAAQMVRLDPELSQLCACMDATKRIVCYHLGSFYQALSADAHTQHGANPHFVIYDELAQAKTRELYDVLATSFGAQANALLLVISTQSSDAQSVMSELCDDAIAQEQGLLEDPTFYGKVYRVPDDADPWDERNWILANPALGDFKVLADMQSQAQKAKRSPSNESAFKNLQLNQRCDGVQAFVNSIDWRACEAEVPDEELAGVEAVGGLDLSGRRDLTALILLFRLPDNRVAVRAWHWTHAENLAERSTLDGAQYVVWREKGFLTVLEGRVIDYSQIAEHLKGILARYKIKQLHFDRWRIHEFARALEAVGLAVAVKEPEKNQRYDVLLIEHGQGYKDMSPAIDSLEDLVLNHQLQHGGNPLLTYCISNVRLTRDPAGNRKFDKRQQNRRIDGAVGMAMAVSGLNKPAEVEQIGPSVYETRGVLVF